MTKDGKLSELEGVSLGIVARDGPCTAYHVRQELRDAPSAHWRASAGSVYPLLTRLEADELIAAKADAADGRGRKLLRVTRKGRRALARWIQAGAAAEMISAVTDPLRSRMFFLDVLGSDDRGQYLDDLIARLQQYLDDIESRHAADQDSGDRFAYLGSLGAVKTTRARLDWLRVVREQLR